MTIWVIGLILGPKAHEDAHYMHRDTCMPPLPSLFNEAYYGPFLHVFDLYLSQTSRH